MDSNSIQVPEKSSNFVLSKINAQGRFVHIVREQYKHDDISCHHPLCKQCVVGTVSLLDQTHYFLPDGETLIAFLDLFESEAVKSLLITETVLQQVNLI
jgi:hypothetical protein